MYAKCVTGKQLIENEKVFRKRQNHYIQVSLNMRKSNSKTTGREKLRYREIGKAFIVTRAEAGMLPGRRLTNAYIDQFNRTYVQVNGELEIVTEDHCFLEA